MTKVEYFRLEDSVMAPGKYFIRFDIALVPGIYTFGNYHIMGARLMNLSFAQYLRFCRDCVGGELIGKGTMYPMVVFNKTPELVALVRLLNTRMNLVMMDRKGETDDNHNNP